MNLVDFNIVAKRELGKLFLGKMRIGQIWYVESKFYHFDIWRNEICKNQLLIISLK